MLLPCRQAFIEKCSAPASAHFFQISRRLSVILEFLWRRATLPSCPKALVSPIHGLWARQCGGVGFAKSIRQTGEPKGKRDFPPPYKRENDHDPQTVHPTGDQCIDDESPLLPHGPGRPSAVGQGVLSSLFRRCSSLKSPFPPLPLQSSRKRGLEPSPVVSRFTKFPAQHPSLSSPLLNAPTDAGTRRNALPVTLTDG